MTQYNGYNVRVIQKKDNEQLCRVIKGVFYELGLPLVGTAYADKDTLSMYCLLYTSPSPRDLSTSRMPSSA